VALRNFRISTSINYPERLPMISRDGPEALAPNPSGGLSMLAAMPAPLNSRQAFDGF
jgi:hypothetical protein